MSLVGPRPLVVDEDAQVRRARSQPATPHTGHDRPLADPGDRVPMQEMVGIDYLYVANWSLWLDLKSCAHGATRDTPRKSVTGAPD